jgi:hypothetical protein
MGDPADDLTPLKLFEYDHDPGSWCLLLSDSEMVKVIEPFEAAGEEGGGYAWEAVARQAVRAHAPQLEGRFGTDPEAGMFVAYGRDVDALRTLGGLLKRAFDERAFLESLIAGVDPDWWD